MSYKVCVFAIPRSVSTLDALASEVSAALVESGGVASDDLFLLAADVEVAWAFTFHAPSDVRVDADYLTGVLRRREALTTLSRVVHNDQVGLYWFEHQAPSSTFELGSAGPYLCGAVEQITTEYPQRGLSNDELKDLHTKAEEQLTAEEYAAIADYKNAARIGFEMFYGSKPNYLACVHAADAWRVWSRDGVPTPEKVLADRGWFAALPCELPYAVRDLDEWASE